MNKLPILRSVACFLWICSLGFATGVYAQAPAYTPGVIAVKLKDGSQGVNVGKTAQGVFTGLAALDQLNAQLSAVNMRRMFRPAGKHEARHIAWGLDRWYIIEFAEGIDAASSLPAYAALADVEVAELQYTKTLSGHVGSYLSTENEAPVLRREAPNDPLYDQQWHYHNVGQVNGATIDADVDLLEAHDIATGSSDVVVIVHDTGADMDHPDLVNAFWTNSGEIPGNGIDDDNNGYVDDVHGYSFADNVPSPEDQNGHGSHTAGTVGATSNNGIGVAGVAGGDGTPGSGVRLMIAQVFGSSSNRGFAESYVYGADNGAVISANSWNYTIPGVFEQSVLDAIDYFIATAGSAPGAPMQGGLVVFSAGNFNSDLAYYPSFYDPTIAVASTGITDIRAYYSDYGTWVDLAAPGGDVSLAGNPGTVLSTLPGGYGFLQGTSMASPHVSGVAALMVSARPGLSNTVIRQVLESTTDDISALNPNFLLGTGRLNAYNALVEIDDDTVAPADVIDLAASASGNWVTLSWTAPGDDGGVGTATRYEAVYANSPIASAEDFAGATALSGLPRPSQAGATEEYTVKGLPFNATVYFALRTIDNVGNVSGVSNSPEATTGAAPVIAADPTSLVNALEPGQRATETVTLSNTGEGPLFFSVDGFAAVARLNEAGAVRNETSVTYGVVEQAKDEVDARVGHPVVMGAGGPDQYGYFWIDSNEDGGPRFTWFDISSLGTSLGLSDEDAASVDLPFTFPFYGMEHEALVVSSNGFLAFSESNSTARTNLEIPLVGGPDAFIAPFWDDLNPGIGGEVYHYYDAARGRFIVQYEDVPRFFAAGSYTFQVMLYPSGRIVFQYLNMGGIAASTTGATIGIESPDGSDGLQIAFNTDYVEAGLAVVINTTPAFIEGVQPVFGEIASGSTQDLIIDISAGVLNAGTYNDEVVIGSNDPNTATLDIAASLTVGGAPNIVVSPAVVDFGTAFVNIEATQTFLVSNTGTALLQVTEIVSDNPHFTVSPASVGIPPGEDVEVSVTVVDDEAADLSGTLTLTSSDPDSPAVPVAVRATVAFPPDIAITPAALSQEVARGLQATQQLTLQNDGLSDLIWEAETRTGTFNGTPAPSRDRSQDVVRTQLEPDETAGDELTAVPGLSATALPFSEGFESGNLGRWVADQTTGTREVTDAQAAEGTFSFRYFNEGLGGHRHGIHHDLTAGSQPAYASFYVRSSSASNADGYFVLTGGGREIIFFYMRSDGNLYINENVGGDASVAYNVNQWYHIELRDIDWADKDFDYYVDGTLVKADVPMRNARVAEGIDQLWLYNFHADAEAWWDGITLSSPWFHVTPASGTLAAGASTTLDVTFDARGVAAGTYDGGLEVTSNDVDEATVTVPLDMTVDIQQFSANVVFQVDMSVVLPDLLPGEVVGIRGGTAPLSWETTLLMEDPDGDGIFTVEVPFVDVDGGATIEYKFVHHPIDESFVMWEFLELGGNANRRYVFDGQNRTLPPVFFNDFDGNGLRLDSYRIRYGGSEVTVAPGQFPTVELTFTNTTAETIRRPSYTEFHPFFDPYAAPHYSVASRVYHHQDIEPGETVTFSNTWYFHVDGNTPDGHLLQIPLVTFNTDGETIGRDILQIPVTGTDTFAPSLSSRSVTPGFVPVGEVATIETLVYEGGEIAQVQAEIEGADGTLVTTLNLVDDGTNGDRVAGDRWYAVQYVPVGEDDFSINLLAEDALGNKSNYQDALQFTSIPFVQTQDVLFIDDWAHNRTTRQAHMEALAASGYTFDHWQTEIRGLIDQETLNQFATVVWTTGSSGFYSSQAYDRVEAYLEQGGRLLVTGQYIASRNQTRAREVLHAEFVQFDVNLYGLNGIAGDPISDDLSIGLNSLAWGPDEVDPLNGAESILLFDGEATNPSVVASDDTAYISDEQVQALLDLQASLTVPPSLQGTAEGDVLEERYASIRERAQAMLAQGLGRGESAVESSGTGGLRYASGDQRLVFLTFGFETIASSLDRGLLMSRTMSWLTGTAAGASLSGQVTLAGSEQPLVGVSLTAVASSGSGAPSATVTTDEEGRYAFFGLADGTYTVTPSMERLSFEPLSREVVVTGADVSDVDFMGALEEPVLVVESYEWAGSSWGAGSNDGAYNPGEFPLVRITVRNTSSETVEGGYWTGYRFEFDLGHDPYVAPHGTRFASTRASSCEDVAAGATSEVCNTFGFHIDGNTPSGEELEVPYQILAGDGRLLGMGTLTFLVEGSDTFAPGLFNTGATPGFVDVGTPTLIEVMVVEGGDIASVEATVESPDETEVATLTLVDDGTGGDRVAGDFWYSVQYTPEVAADFVVDFEAVDGAGNTRQRNNGAYVTSVPFEKTEDVLLVTGWLSSRTIREAHEQALAAAGYRFNYWETELRGLISQEVMDQFSTVVWAAGSIWLESSATFDRIEAYLEQGGQLLMSGREVAEGNRTRTREVLHAEYVQSSASLYRVNGVTGDPISDGLSIGLSNQAWDIDEIDPVNGAEAIFIFDESATTPSVAAVEDAAYISEAEVEALLEERAALMVPPSLQGTAEGETLEAEYAVIRQEAQAELGRLRGADEASGGKVTVSTVESSGTGGLRYTSGDQRLVFLTFGFETIASSLDRGLLMSRTMSWLTGTAAGASLSGQVTLAGSEQPLAAVSVTAVASSGSGAPSATVTTDEEGRYAFFGLADGTYTVTPSMERLSFEPLSREVVVSGIDVSDVDFSGTLEEPVLVVESYEQVGYSWGSGNNDGAYNPGEFPSVRLTVRNASDATVTSGYRIELDLSFDPYVAPHGPTYTDASLHSCEDVAAGATSDVCDRFDFYIDGNTPSGEELEVPYQILASDGRLLGMGTLTFLVEGSDTFAPGLFSTRATPGFVDVGTPTLIEVMVVEGGDIASVAATVESPDETEVATLTLVDDGTGGDRVAGDRWFSAQYMPEVAADFVVDFEAIDGSSNIRTRANGAYFTSVPFEQTEDVLLITERSSDRTTREAHEQALVAAGYSFNSWNTQVRGLIPQDVMDQFGTVVWAAGYHHFVNSAAFDRVEAYLEQGGQLLVSGREVAEGNRTRAREVLHADYVQSSVSLYRVNGVTGDPVSDGLSIGLSNQAWDIDEIDPVGGAEAIFLFDESATTPSVVAVEDAAYVNEAEVEALLEERAALMVPPSLQGTSEGETLEAEYAVIRQEARAELDRLRGVAGETSSGEAVISAVESSGTGGLRYASGDQRLVFLTFGFETIASSTDRGLLMSRTMSWLTGTAAGASVSGQVTLAGGEQPLAAVSVTAVASSGSGAPSATVTTDEEGRYAFFGLADGTYTVTPSDERLSFEPLNREVVVTGTDVSDVDFAGTLEEPVLVVESYEQVGYRWGSGNDDGAYNPGEFPSVQLTVRNASDATVASGYRIELDLAFDPYQSVYADADLHSCEDVAPGATSDVCDRFDFYIDGNTPSGEELEVPYRILANDGRLLGIGTLTFLIEGSDTFAPFADIISVNPGVISKYVEIGSQALINVLAVDGGDVALVEAVLELPDGTEMARVTLVDDGTGADPVAGDRWFNAYYTPEVAADFVVDIVLEDGAGNRGQQSNGAYFTSVPFEQTEDVLLITERALSQTTRQAHEQALEAAGYSFNSWNTQLRGLIPQDVMNQFATVIWAPGFDWFVNSSAYSRMESYLNQEGQLLVAGNDVAHQHKTRTREVLRAEYVQNYARLYRVNGVTDDPVSDGLSIGLNNLGWSSDEVDPVAGAEAILLFDEGATTPSVAAVDDAAYISEAELEALFEERAALTVPPSLQGTAEGETLEAAYAVIRQEAQAELDRLRGADEASGGEAAVSAVGSSGTAGVRFSSGDRRLVFLTFGFEAIASSIDRGLLMSRTMSWLTGTAAGASLSGKVTVAGGEQPLVGVSLTAVVSSGSGAPSATVTTDEEGRYAFFGLASGTYTVTPSGERFSFDPASREVVVSGADVSDVDFSGTLEEPVLVVESYALEGYGWPGGNDDSEYNPGEFPRVRLTVRNASDATVASGYRIELDMISDPYVAPHGPTYTDANLHSCEDVAAGATSDVCDRFDFYIDGNTPSGEELEVPYQILASDGRLLGLGTLTFPVTGTDTTAPGLPGGTANPRYVEIGAATLIEVLVIEGGDIASVEATVESPDETEVATLTLVDDGTGGDRVAGDRWFSAQYTPEAAFDFVVDFEAVDGVGNRGQRSNGVYFTSVPFEQTEDVLLITERALSQTTRQAHEQALEAAGYSFNYWNTQVRGLIPQDVMNQFATVIWAPGFDWFIYSSAYNRMEAYLDQGGQLLVSGSNVAQQSTTRTRQVLRADHVQNNVRLYRVNGVTGDPVSDGLSMGLNNVAWDLDEVDPVGGAEAILRFDEGATSPSVAAVDDAAYISEAEIEALLEERAALVVPPSLEGTAEGESLEAQYAVIRQEAQAELDRLRGAAGEDSRGGEASVSAINSSGTAGLRYASGDQRLVFLTFGFETIASSVDRGLLMSRTMSWLTGTAAGASVSGQVTLAGGEQPLVGVSMMAVASSGGGAPSATVTTDEQGRYAFFGLADGTYTVTPSGERFSFDPASREVVVSGMDVLDVDFAGTLVDPVLVVESYEQVGHRWVAGNSDGAYNPGEFPLVRLTVRNASDATVASGYRIELDLTFDPYVAPHGTLFTDANLHSCEDVAAGATSDVCDTFDFYIDGNTPSGEELEVPYQILASDSRLLGLGTLTFPVTGTDTFAPGASQVNINSGYVEVDSQVLLEVSVLEGGDVPRAEAILESPDETEVATLTLVDDGTGGDRVAGDRWYSAQYTPEVAMEFIVDVVLEDGAGNTGEWNNTAYFTSVPFEKTEDVLYIDVWRPGFVNVDFTVEGHTLTKLGLSYDYWPQDVRGVIPQALLNQYATVIWNTSSGLRSSSDRESESRIQAYLAQGGRLLLMGQQIASWANPDWARSTLHATLVQSDAGLYGVVGVKNDPISHGLTVPFNDQAWRPDEVDPVDDAVAIFRFDETATSPTTTSALEVGGLQTDRDTALEVPPSLVGTPQGETLAVYYRDTENGEASNAQPAAIISSGTAGLRYAEGEQRLVFLTFGLDDIAHQADREAVLGQSLSWLRQTTEVQDVTARQINDIPDANIEALTDGGVNLAIEQIQELIFNDLVGQRVRFGAVVMSDPRNSGLASLFDGQPARVHMFVRDTTAAQDGMDGMGMQLVGSASSGILDVNVGDVVSVVGTVAPFNTIAQLSLEQITRLGTYSELGFSETLLDPVPITTQEANSSLATGAPQIMSGGGAQVNWTNLERLRAQFVRLEGATVVAHANVDSRRPDFLISSDHDETIVPFFDTSLRYRNDRADYPSPPFNVRTTQDGDFVVPALGARVRIQGFLTMVDDPFGRSQPTGAVLNISPFEDRGCDGGDSNLRCDLEVIGQPLDFSAALTITDATDARQRLRFGTAPDATDGFDENLDRFAPPPAPSGFDARFRTGNEDFLEDYRASIANDAITWGIRVQVGGNSTPITYTWDASQFPAEGTFRLTDGITGTLFNIDMRAQQSYVETFGVGTLRVTYSTNSQHVQSLLQNWNLVGLPMTMDNQQYNHLYQNCTLNSLYHYNPQTGQSPYVLETQLEHGNGYWLHCAQAHMVTLEGQPVTQLSLNLREGWNMVSGPMCAIAVDQIQDPNGIIISSTLFGFDRRYEARDRVAAGEGYWIRTRMAGTVVFDCANATTEPAAKSGDDPLADMKRDLEAFNHLHIEDGEANSQDVYFGYVLPEGYDPRSFSLPPRSPNGGFDIRFADDTWVSVADMANIAVQADTYPLTLTWVNGTGTLEVEEMLHAGEMGTTHEVTSGGSLELQDRAIIALRIRPAGGDAEVPLAYTLDANYPNPFNPETTILYALPEASPVKLTVYNALGQVVKELVNAPQEAGRYRVRWEAGDAASGVYYYVLEAGTFKSVRQMVLLK